MTTAAPQSIQPITASERDQIVARLSDLQAKQEAATEWGAAVGAREEEIRSLESRLLRIDSMTAPPSTETLRHTSGGSSEVSREEYVRLIDAIDYTLTVHGKIDADTPLHDRIRKVYRAPIPVNFRSSHAALTARVAELERLLDAAAGLIADARSGHIAGSDYDERWDADKRDFTTARAALDNADGGREYDPNVAPCDDAEFGMKP